MAVLDCVGDIVFCWLMAMLDIFFFPRCLRERCFCFADFVAGKLFALLKIYSAATNIYILLQLLKNQVSWRICRLCDQKGHIHLHPQGNRLLHG